MRAFSKLTAWALVLGITFLSLSPPDYRPVTPAGHSPEHFLIYLAVGFALDIGYPNRWRILMPTLIAFAGAIEVAQLFVSGRHARVIDFVVDAVAACIGVALLGIGRMVKRALSERQL